MITVSDLGLQYSGQPLFSHVDLQFVKGNCYGIIGANGAGKSTFLKILSGELEPTSGEVSILPKTRMSVLKQDQNAYNAYTVMDTVIMGNQRLYDIGKEKEALYAKEDMTEEDGIRACELEEEYAELGGWESESDASRILQGLGIPVSMHYDVMENVDGRLKVKVLLAQALFGNPDILLLDEPTNHLDLHATEWLEDYLERFKGTVLAISHDRWFLDKVVKRVVEVLDGKAELYSGNYSFYVEEKERRYQERLKQYEKEQAKIAQLEAAAEQMRLWAFKGNDKQYKRAINMERRIERMRTTDKPTKERKLATRFGEREFRGDEALTVTHLAKSFGERTLFSDLNLEVAGGERIALLGDNGTGKSTFLKLLLDEEQPDSGSVYWGPAIRVGYLPQIIRFDRPDRNLVDTMLYAQNCTTQEARDRLAAFKFRGEDVFKPVSALSGGEQSRLRLCMLMDSKINFLILDEPTNHLDIDSREWIEEAVAEYGGNLLFVSHDRYFIEKFAQRVWMLENGGITDFRGTYSEFRTWRERQAQLKNAARQTLPEPIKPKEDKPRRSGGTKELEKQVRSAERAVEKAEVRLDELAQEMEAAASDYLKLQDLYAEREKLEDELAHLYTEWEKLAAELEEAKS